MKQKIIQGTLLDNQVELSLNELSSACSSSTEWIIELVEEGALEPVDYQQSSWQFPATSLKRVLAAMRLQRDLGINIAGIALALDLLEEIEALESQLRHFKNR